MAFFCVTMLDMALILAEKDPVYEDMASKYFEHFILIVDAINSSGQGRGLWDDEDGFYYDYIRMPDGSSVPMKVRRDILYRVTGLRGVDEDEGTQ